MINSTAGEVRACQEAFTVAVCTRNRSEFLRDCLAGLIRSLGDIPAPIVVVDNGSTDATQDVVAEFLPRVALLVEPDVGLSRARNRVLAECNTEYLVFLDDDAVPDPSWGRAVTEITRTSFADVFGGPYIPFYNEPKPDWFDDVLGSAHVDLTDGLQPPHVCFSGGNMGWRTTLLRKWGGFDPKLGMSGRTIRLGEETALQVKMRHAEPELKFLFSNEMLMVHYVAPEKMKLRYIFRRSCTYGWQLYDLDPADPNNELSMLLFATRTRLGLPLIWRALFRDRQRYPHWRSFAAQYLALNAILLGAQTRRWARRRICTKAARGEGS